MVAGQQYGCSSAFCVVPPRRHNLIVLQTGNAGSYMHVHVAWMYLQLLGLHSRPPQSLMSICVYCDVM